MTLLLSHSQQLLDSQSQAYANLLCWRPSNLFFFPSSYCLSTGQKESERKKKILQNVERGFPPPPHSSPFCFSPTTFPASIHHLPPRTHSHSPSLSNSFASCFIPLHKSVLRFYPLAPPLARGLCPSPLFSLSLSLSTSVSASNSNSNSNSFIGMTRESLARAHSPWLPLHKAPRPGPVTSALSWSTGCVMLRRGNHPCVLGQICGQTHYGHVSVIFV